MLILELVTECMLFSPDEPPEQAGPPGLALNATAANGTLAEGAAAFGSGAEEEGSGAHALVPWLAQSLICSSVCMPGLLLFKAAWSLRDWPLVRSCVREPSSEERKSAAVLLQSRARGWHARRRAAVLRVRSQRSGEAAFAAAVERQAALEAASVGRYGLRYCFRHGADRPCGAGGEGAGSGGAKAAHGLRAGSVAYARLEEAGGAGEEGERKPPPRPASMRRGPLVGGARRARVVRHARRCQLPGAWFDAIAWGAMLACYALCAGIVVVYADVFGKGQTDAMLLSWSGALGQTFVLQEPFFIALLVGLPLALRHLPALGCVAGAFGSLEALGLETGVCVEWLVWLADCCS